MNEKWYQKGNFMEIGLRLYVVDLKRVKQREAKTFAGCYSWEQERVRLLWKEIGLFVWIFYSVRAERIN